MRVLSVLLLLYAAAMGEAIKSQLSLRYAEPKDVLATVDSIPVDSGEKIVLSYRGPDGMLRAYWIVVLLNSPYSQTQMAVRESVRNKFGIEKEREISVDVERQPNVNPNEPKDPLYGDGFADFRAIGTPVTGGHEYRIETKQYNQSGRNTYSMSEWRLIDCRPLFSRECAIVVVSRIDYSREWVWMHPGIPLPWKQESATRLVTNKEITLIEQTATRLGQPLMQSFVPYSGYKSNGVINTMKEIFQAARDLPKS